MARKISKVLTTTEVRGKVHYLENGELTYKTFLTTLPKEVDEPQAIAILTKQNPGKLVEVTSVEVMRTKYVMPLETFMENAVVADVDEETDTEN